MVIDSQRRSLVPSFFAERLETILNRALRYAPGTQAALTELDGESISIIATHPNLQLTLEFCDNEIQVSHYWEGTPTVSIHGPLISILFQLGLNKSPGELIASNIQVEGDQDFAQQLATIFRENDLDLEEPIPSEPDAVPRQSAQGQMLDRSCQLLILDSRGCIRFLQRSAGGQWRSPRCTHSAFPIYGKGQLTNLEIRHLLDSDEFPRKSHCIQPQAHSATIREYIHYFHQILSLNHQVAERYVTHQK